MHFIVSQSSLFLFTLTSLMEISACDMQYFIFVYFVSILTSHIDNKSLLRFCDLEWTLDFRSNLEGHFIPFHVATRWLIAGVDKLILKRAMALTRTTNWSQFRRSSQYVVGIIHEIILVSGRAQRALRHASSTMPANHSSTVSPSWSTFRYKVRRCNNKSEMYWQNWLRW